MRGESLSSVLALAMYPLMLDIMVLTLLNILLGLVTPQEASLYRRLE